MVPEELGLAKDAAAAVVMQLSLKYVKATLLYLVVRETLLLLTFTHVLPFEITVFYFIKLYGFIAMMILGLSYLFVPSSAHGFLYSLRLKATIFWPSLPSCF